MASHVHLDLAVDPARIDEFLAFLEPLLPDTRAYAGFRSIDVLVDVDNPGHVVFQEAWESRAHHEKYLAWRTESGALAKLGEYLNSPPALAYFSRADV